MKKLTSYARHYVWLFLALPLAALGQETDSFPNYVVIGAFAYRENAVNFTDDAKQQQFPARFEMNPNRNLYYVYVFTTADRDIALAEAVRLRAETKYFDTWVYSGGFGKLQLAKSVPTSNTDIDPVTGALIESIPSISTEQIPDIRTPPRDSRTQVGDSRKGVSKDDLTIPQDDNSEAARNTGPVESTHTSKRPATAEKRQSTVSEPFAVRAVEPSAQSGVTPKVDVASPARKAPHPHDTRRQDEHSATSADAGTIADSIADTSVSTNSSMEDDDRYPEGDNSVDVDPIDNKVTSAVPVPAPKRVTSSPLQKEDVVGKNFYFYLFRGDNGNTIGGEVDAIDVIRSRKMATYPANESVSVHLPSGDSKRVSFICQVFGYRKQQKEYDPAAPEEELYLDDQGNVVIPFELVRLQKGDIAIMYNVFFFKDAAVMRPESRYEVNNLLELLQENPSYKIRIHGHTNGNASGKIIRMDTPGNFYSLTGTKQGFGSAKKLSEERAEVIRGFLIHSGIPEDRMSIKAWGGKKPLHDPRSARAVENVRVEIEILSK